MFGPFPRFPRGPFPRFPRGSFARFAFGTFDGFAFGSLPGFPFCAFGGFPFIRFDGFLLDRCSRLHTVELSGGVSRGFCRGVGLCFRGLARVCDRHSVRPAPPAARPDPIAGGPPGMRSGFVGRACDDAFDRGGSRDLDPEEITVVGARSRPEERVADSCERRRDVWADSRSGADSRSAASMTMRASRGTRAVPCDARALRRSHAALRHGRCGSGANRDNERCRDVG
jgi:hypothetical protein